MNLMNITHSLQCFKNDFEAIVAGHKTHDLRRCDETTLKAGDRLLLQEFDPQNQAYSGREQMVEITYITSANQPCALSNGALNEKFAILSIKLV